MPEATNEQPPIKPIDESHIPKEADKPTNNWCKIIPGGDYRDQEYQAQFPGYLDRQKAGVLNGLSNRAFFELLDGVFQKCDEEGEIDLQEIFKLQAERRLPGEKRTRSSEVVKHEIEVKSAPAFRELLKKGIKADELNHSWNNKPTVATV